MVGERPGAALGALGVLGVFAALAASCAALVGADEDRVSVAEILCDCPKLDFLGGSCVTEVAKRLGEVSDEARADWMRAADAKECFTSCDKALECYRTAPACSNDLCNTGDSSECCAGLSCDTESKLCSP